MKISVQFEDNNNSITHLKCEDHLISWLRSESPEEGVSLVSPDQAVMLVMLDGRLCNSEGDNL